MAAPWVPTPSLAALRRDIDKVYPGRDRRSDGTIGDEAHQGSKSGHNPDESGNAEFQDADNKNEVRALDIDVNLRPAFDTSYNQRLMHVLIDDIVSTGADRNRLAYIIFDGLFWSRNTNWEPRAYLGSNPHRVHAHFSGHPDSDEDNRPWKSIYKLEGIDVAESSDTALRAEWRIATLFANLPATPGGDQKGETNQVRVVFDLILAALSKQSMDIAALRTEVQTLRNLIAQGMEHGSIPAVSGTFRIERIDG